jgi:acyl-CoA synthetase (AMP-forming)/AMP-acid ligase II
MQGIPQTVNSTIMTSPALLPGLSMGERWTAPRWLSGKTEALRAAARAALAPHKVPKDFSFLEALPRGPTGKVLKRTLKAAGSRPAPAVEEPQE